MNVMGYLKLIKTISYHNNLGMDIIKQLYEKDMLICGTRLFWDEHGRRVIGETDKIKIPVYKYKYISKYNGKPVKYSDMTQRELREAVKIGVVDKKEYIGSYKEIELIRIENTDGKRFESKEYDINHVKLMQKVGKYDLNKLIGILIEESETQWDIKIDIEDALGGLLEQTTITDIRIDAIKDISEQLIKIFNIIDKKVERKKLIDLKKEKLDELADSIICTIEARNIRKIIGGADLW